jgi:hypothetical protein
MNFASFLRSWIAASITAVLWAAVLAFSLSVTIPVAGIILNSFVAGLLFSVLLFGLHMPFRKAPTILSSIATGWLFVALFVLYQHSFSGEMLQLAVMAFFGMIMGVSAFLGINRLSFKSKA